MNDLPKQMGPYEIRREIGSGGMGVVYEGWDGRLNRRVAIKTLWPTLAERDEARERFLREARAAAAVSHPNVTQIYDIGEQDGRVYFAMEYLEAESLRQVLRRTGRLSPDKAISIVSQAARGLRAAAERGIVHRDIKPSNLVFTADGTVKVTDFGLAKQILSDKDLTMDGQTIGTPKYLSPEQASGGLVDVRSDIYSLGATLFEMVTGRPPFEGSSAMTVMMKHIQEPVPPVQQINASVPRSLASLIHRMLAKQSAARPQDYDELLRLLARVGQDQTGTARRTGTTTVMPSVAPAMPENVPAKSGFAGRLFLFTVLGLMLIVGAGLAIKSIGTTDPPPDPPSTAGDTASVTPEAAPRPSVARPPADPPAAIGGPGSDATPLRVEDSGAVLEIVDAAHEITEDGRLIVSGQVANTGTSRAMNTKVRISLTDRRGNLLSSTEVFLTPHRLAQGEEGHFEAVFADPEQSIKIVFELNWIS